MMTQLYLVTGSGASTISFIVMMVAMIALFYFMLIRPQQKQQKKINDMLNNLKVGDRVKTIGGLYGRIVRIKTNCNPTRTAAADVSRGGFSFPQRGSALRKRRKKTIIDAVGKIRLQSPAVRLPGASR